MLDFLHAIVLGIVQGLTELLPVSSSAHLLIIPKIMHWKSFGLAFDVSLHTGTTLAIIIFFFKDYWQILISYFKKETTLYKKTDQKLGLAIALSCIPAGIVGLLFQDVIENYFRSPIIAGANLIVFGIILFLADHLFKGTKKTDGITYLDALFIGIFQTLALIPGVSRSGITITAGLVRKLKRAEAARFSFLMIAPLVAGATVLELYKMHSSLIKSGKWQLFLNHQIYVFIVGSFVSCIVGILCIKYFLQFLKKFRLDAFVIYRIIVGATVIWLFLPH